MPHKITLPHWLDGRTIALLTMMAALGAMMQTGFIDIRSEIRQVRGEIGQLRAEMRDEIGQVRGEIGQLRSELRLDLHRVEDRVQNVEMEVTAIKASMAPATKSEEVAAR